jgi:hypothetical protein
LVGDHESSPQLVHYCGYDIGCVHLSLSIYILLLWHTYVTVLLGLKILHLFILYPWVLSPLRTVPGPKGPLWSMRYILFGEFPKIMRTEAGILQREWSKLYGKAVRAVGPFGLESVMFLSPAAMQKVLVDDWENYPRVSSQRS